MIHMAVRWLVLGVHGNQVNQGDSPNDTTSCAKDFWCGAKELLHVPQPASEGGGEWRRPRFPRTLSTLYSTLEAGKLGVRGEG